MTNDNKFIWVLQSRKFWSAVVGLIAILYVAWAKGDSIDPNTIVNAILGIVAAYIGATAYEDSQQAKANATVDAATVTAAAAVNTTTVTTPGESDVTVTAPPAPKSPTLGNMGG